MPTEIDREELAWAAGFFDGEGYSGLLAKRTLRCHIPQTDRRPLERFRKAVGNLGIIDGPKHSNNPNHSTQWIWRVSGFTNTQAVIAMLWAFLSLPKREQAKTALMIYLSRRHRGGARCSRGHSDWYLRPNGSRICRICMEASQARKVARYHDLHPTARYNPYPARRRSTRTEGGPYMHAE